MREVWEKVVLGMLEVMEAWSSLSLLSLVVVVVAVVLLLLVLSSSRRGPVRSSWLGGGMVG